MEISDVLKFWKLSDQAQLDSYYESNAGNAIRCGNRDFWIHGLYMDTDYDVPMIELIDINGYLDVVQLSLIWNEYRNFSALPDEARLQLLKDYNIPVE